MEAPKGSGSVAKEGGNPSDCQNRKKTSTSSVSIDDGHVDPFLQLFSCNDSFDTTHFLSYSPTITPVKSQRWQPRLPAVDAPGWVHNAGNIITQECPVLQRPTMLPTTVAPIILKSHRHTASEASRSLASNLPTLGYSGFRSQASGSLSSRESFTDKQLCGTVASILHPAIWKESQSQLTRSYNPAPERPVWPPDSMSIVCRNYLSKGQIASNHSSFTADERCDILSNASQRSVSDEVNLRLPPISKAQAARKMSTTSESFSASSDIFGAILKCSSRESNDSMPPPSLALPRKDVRDAIKYHHKLGHALSKLVPDTPEINGGGKGNDVLNSVASTCSTVSSTLDSSRLDRGLDYANRSSIASRASKNIGFGYNPDDDCTSINPLIHVSSKQLVANFDQFNSDDHLSAYVSSKDSAFSSSMDYSSNSDPGKLEQHLSFLENHMVQNFRSSDKLHSNDGQCLVQVASTNMSDQIISISVPANNNGTFFPRVEDLKSPPKSTCSSVTQADVVPYSRLHSTTINKSITPICIASPPRTPMGTLNQPDCSVDVDSFDYAANSPQVDWNDDDTVEQEDLDTVLNEGILLKDAKRRVREETTSVMSEMKDKIRPDIETSMDSEVEKLCSMFSLTTSEMIKCSGKVWDKLDEENHHSQFASTEKEISSPSLGSIQKEAQFPSSHHHATVFPAFFNRTSMERNVVDNRVLLEKLEKRLYSLEASLVSKVSAQMNQDAMQQRQKMEEIIEEKVCKAIAGSNLEVKMLVQEFMKESEHMSKMALCGIRTPPQERTSPRMRSPPLGMSSSMKTKLLSPCGQAPSQRTNHGKRSINSDDYWVHCGHSNKANQVAEDPIKQTLEHSFAETMRAIDDFVDECDDIADSFDRIAFRMQDSDIPSDPHCDPGNKLECAGQLIESSSLATS